MCEWGGGVVEYFDFVQAQRKLLEIHSSFFAIPQNTVQGCNNWDPAAGQRR